MTQEELVVKISASTAEFTSQIKDVNKEIDSVGTKSTDSGAKLKSAFGSAAKTLAIGATAAVGAGAAIYKFTENIASNGDEIDKQSQKLGVSAEQYQTLAFAAEHSGFSMSAFTAAQKTLLKTDPTANIYDELNALMAIEDPAERSAAACEKFGIKAGREMAALLNGGGSLDDYKDSLTNLGGMMSNEMVANSAAFEDAVTDVQRSFSGAGRSLVTELMPYITQLMNNVSKFVADGGLQKIVDTFKVMAPVIAAVTAAMVAYKASMAIIGMIKAFQAATEGVTIAQAALNLVMSLNPIVLIVTLIAGLVAALIVLWNTNDDFRNAVKGAWAAVKNAFTTAINAIKKALTAMKNAITNIFNTVKNTITNTVSNIKNGLINGFTTAVNKVKSVVSTVKNVITSPFKAAWKIVSGVIGKLKSAFNFSWHLPKLKLPHISVSGGKAPFGIAGKGSLPKFSINWYKQGGVFDQPSVIGVGEAGTEAVMPLEKNTGWIDVLAGKLNNSMGNSNSNKPVSIILQVDKQRLGKVTISSINDIIEQEGIIPLAI